MAKLESLPQGYAASRLLRENDRNAVVNAIGANNIGFRDGRRRSEDEIKGMLQNDSLQLTFNSRDAAVQVLLKMDSDQNGYLEEGEFQVNQKFMNTVDGYGSRKYGAENGRTVVGPKNRIRETGEAAKDGRMSISEIANALVDKVLNVGSRIGAANRDLTN